MSCGTRTDRIKSSNENVCVQKQKLLTSCSRTMTNQVRSGEKNRSFPANFLWWSQPWKGNKALTELILTLWTIKVWLSYLNVGLHRFRLHIFLLAFRCSIKLMLKDYITISHIWLSWKYGFRFLKQKKHQFKRTLQKRP